MTNQSRWIDIGEGCRRDAILYTRLDGSRFYREWTNTLNPKRGVTFAKAKTLAEECDLLGGGWRSPTPADMLSIVDYSRVSPAIDVAAFPDTKSDWYWTGQVHASPSGCAWFVSFLGGGVLSRGLGYTGFVRACREVPA